MACYLQMLPRLTAEERLESAMVQAVGSGAVKEPGDYLKEWQEAAEPDHYRPKRKLDKEHYQLQLADLGMFLEG